MLALVMILGIMAAPPPPALGWYSATTVDYVGFMQLVLSADGTAVYRNVVSFELPPLELETAKLRWTYEDGKLCVKPALRSMEPCLSRIDATHFSAVASPSKSKLVFERLPEERQRPPFVVPDAK